MKLSTIAAAAPFIVTIVLLEACSQEPKNVADLYFGVGNIVGKVDCDSKKLWLDPSKIEESNKAFAGKWYSVGDLAKDLDKRDPGTEGAAKTIYTAAVDQSCN